ncbi:hypothetical protein BN159_2573 [Streptomyces davaonensis JCM 4913]|uniref:Uncharacterized protein n=1 Tax=Streptomyces davaonensis (strain DSM 101723 / JCM 4913 / KCC S-0913 / 768) TaxID=1214101 RepID=K4R1E7_STRDJ|nr:hypothetical protein BN159_2573 [Streptomyces davaonensis JCM 4913]
MGRRGQATLSAATPHERDRLTRRVDRNAGCRCFPGAGLKDDRAAATGMLRFSANLRSRTVLGTPVAPVPCRTDGWRSLSSRAGMRTRCQPPQFPASVGPSPRAAPDASSPTATGAGKPGGPPSRPPTTSATTASYSWSRATRRTPCATPAPRGWPRRESRSTRFSTSSAIRASRSLAASGNPAHYRRMNPSPCPSRTTGRSRPRDALPCRTGCPLPPSAWAAGRKRGGPLRWFLSTRGRAAFQTWKVRRRGWRTFSMVRHPAGVARRSTGSP